MQNKILKIIITIILAITFAAETSFNAYRYVPSANTLPENRCLSPFSDSALRPLAIKNTSAGHIFRGPVDNIIPQLIAQTDTFAPLRESIDRLDMAKKMQSLLRDKEERLAKLIYRPANTLDRIPMTVIIKMAIKDLEEFGLMEFNAILANRDTRGWAHAWLLGFNTHDLPTSPPLSEEEQRLKKILRTLVGEPPDGYKGHKTIGYTREILDYAQAAGEEVLLEYLLHEALCPYIGHLKTREVLERMFEDTNYKNAEAQGWSLFIKRRYGNLEGPLTGIIRKVRRGIFYVAEPARPEAAAAPLPEEMPEENLPVQVTTVKPEEVLDRIEDVIFSSSLGPRDKEVIEQAIDELANLGIRGRQQFERANRLMGALLIMAYNREASESTAGEIFDLIDTEQTLQDIRNAIVDPRQDAETNTIRQGAILAFIGILANNRNVQAVRTIAEYAYEFLNNDNVKAMVMTDGERAEDELARGLMNTFRNFYGRRECGAFRSEVLSFLADFAKSKGQSAISNEIIWEIAFMFEKVKGQRTEKAIKSALRDAMIDMAMEQLKTSLVPTDAVDFALTLLKEDGDALAITIMTDLAVIGEERRTTAERRIQRSRKLLLSINQSALRPMAGMQKADTEKFVRTMMAVMYSFHEVNNKFVGLYSDFADAHKHLGQTQTQCAYLETYEQETESVVEQFRALTADVTNTFRRHDKDADHAMLQQQWAKALEAIKENLVLSAGKSKFFLSDLPVEINKDITRQCLEMAATFDIFLSYIETGKLTLNMGEINIIDFLKIRTQLGKQEPINIVLDLDSSLSIIQIDKDLLSLLIRNIQQNANDAMLLQETEETVPKETEKTFVVKAYREDNLAVISFSDTGPGISEQDLQRIFEPFFTKGKPKGTGLGLALVREMVRQIGGEISVESELGKGTTFTVRLPINPAADASKNITPTDQAFTVMQQAALRPLASDIIPDIVLKIAPSPDWFGKYKRIDDPMAIEEYFHVMVPRALAEHLMSNADVFTAGKGEKQKIIRSAVETILESAKRELAYFLKKCPDADQKKAMQYFEFYLQETKGFLSQEGAVKTEADLNSLAAIQATLPSPGVVIIDKYFGSKWIFYTNCFIPGINTFPVHIAQEPYYTMIQPAIGNSHFSETGEICLHGFTPFIQAMAARLKDPRFLLKTAAGALSEDMLSNDIIEPEGMSAPSEESYAKKSEILFSYEEICLKQHRETGVWLSHMQNEIEKEHRQNGTSLAEAVIALYDELSGNNEEHFTFQGSLWVPLKSAARRISRTETADDAFLRAISQLAKWVKENKYHKKTSLLNPQMSRRFFLGVSAAATVSASTIIQGQTSMPIPIEILRKKYGKQPYVAEMLSGEPCSTDLIFRLRSGTEVPIPTNPKECIDFAYRMFYYDDMAARFLGYGMPARGSQGINLGQSLWLPFDNNPYSKFKPYESLLERLVINEIDNILSPEEKDMRLLARPTTSYAFNRHENADELNFRTIARETAMDWMADRDNLTADFAEMLDEIWRDTKTINQNTPLSSIEKLQKRHCSMLQQFLEEKIKQAVKEYCAAAIKRLRSDIAIGALPVDDGFQDAKLIEGHPDYAYMAALKLFYYNFLLKGPEATTEFFKQNFENRFLDELGKNETVKNYVDMARRYKQRIRENYGSQFLTTTRETIEAAKRFMPQAQGMSEHDRFKFLLEHIPRVSGGSEVLLNYLYGANPPDEFFGAFDKATFFETELMLEGFVQDPEIAYMAEFTALMVALPIMYKMTGRHASPYASSRPEDILKIVFPQYPYEGPEPDIDKLYNWLLEPLPPAILNGSTPERRLKSALKPRNLIYYSSIAAAAPDAANAANTYEITGETLARQTGKISHAGMGAIQEAALRPMAAKNNIINTALCDSENLLIAKTARIATEGCSTDEKKILALASWVADNISYGIGYGAYWDATASETLIRRHGMCFNMANLLIAMARSVGIEAEYGVVLRKKETFEGLVPQARYEKMGPTSEHIFARVFIKGEWKIIDIGYAEKTKPAFLNEAEFLARLPFTMQGSIRYHSGLDALAYEKVRKDTRAERDAYEDELIAGLEQRNDYSRSNFNLVRSDDELIKIASSMEFIASLDEDAKLDIVMPMWEETVRLNPKSASYKNGEDALRKKIRQFMILSELNPHFKWRLIAVDDGSNEASSAECVRTLWQQICAEYAQEGQVLRDDQLQIIIIPKEQKEGKKGGAVLTGLKRSLDDKWADATFITDVDTSISLSEIGNVIRPVYEGQADVAIGSRRCEGATEKEPFLRGISSAAFSRAVGAMLPPIAEIKDTQRGFKLFRREVLEDILGFAQDSTLTFDTELLLLTKLAGYHIKEVAIAWFDSAEESRVSRLRDPAKMLWNIARQRKRILSPAFIKMFKATVEAKRAKRQSPQAILRLSALEIEAAIKDFFEKDIRRNASFAAKHLFSESTTVEDIQDIKWQKVHEGIFLHIFKAEIQLHNGKSGYVCVNVPTEYGEHDDLAKRDFDNLAKFSGAYPEKIARPVVIDKAETGAGQVNVFATEWLSGYSELNDFYKDTPHLNVGSEYHADRLTATVKSLVEIADYNLRWEQVSFINQVKLSAGDFLLRQDPASDEISVKLITIRGIAQDKSPREFLDYLLGNKFCLLHHARHPEAALHTEAVLKGILQGLISKFGQGQGAKVFKRWISVYRNSLIERGSVLNSSLRLDRINGWYKSWLEMMIADEDLKDARFHAQERAILKKYLEDKKMTRQVRLILEEQRELTRAVRQGVDNFMAAYAPEAASVPFAMPLKQPHMPATETTVSSAALRPMAEKVSHNRKHREKLPDKMEWTEARVIECIRALYSDVGSFKWEDWMNSEHSEVIKAVVKGGLFNGRWTKAVEAAGFKAITNWTEEYAAAYIRAHYDEIGSSLVDIWKQSPHSEVVWAIYKHNLFNGSWEEAIKRSEVPVTGTRWTEDFARAYIIVHYQEVKSTNSKIWARAGHGCVFDAIVRYNLFNGSWTEAIKSAGVVHEFEWTEDMVAECIRALYSDVGSFKWEDWMNSEHSEVIKAVVKGRLFNGKWRDAVEKVKAGKIQKQKKWTEKYTIAYIRAHYHEVKSSNLRAWNKAGHGEIMNKIKANNLFNKSWTRATKKAGIPRRVNKGTEEYVRAYIIRYFDEVGSTSSLAWRNAGHVRVVQSVSYYRLFGGSWDKAIESAKVSRKKFNWTETAMAECIKALYIDVMSASKESWLNSNFAYLVRTVEKNNLFGGSWARAVEAAGFKTCPKWATEEYVIAYIRSHYNKIGSASLQVWRNSGYSDVVTAIYRYKLFGSSWTEAVKRAILSPFTLEEEKVLGLNPLSQPPFTDSMLNFLFAETAFDAAA